MGLVTDPGWLAPLSAVAVAVCRVGASDTPTGGATVLITLPRTTVSCVFVREFNLRETIFSHYGRELTDLFGIGWNSGHAASWRRSALALGRRELV